MACSFIIPFTGTASSLISAIKARVLAGDGMFDGDASVGKFSIHAIGATIDGTYGICDNEIMVTIERKPFFVSCNMIKGYVMENLTG